MFCEVITQDAIWRVKKVTNAVCNATLQNTAVKNNWGGAHDFVIPLYESTGGNTSLCIFIE